MTMHDGHRRRLRERFRLDGLEGFAPHEVLELLLFYARARGDVNPLSHRLLDTFGSLRGVLEAPVDQLCAVEGVGEETATLISLIVPMFRRYERCLCEEKMRLTHYRDVQDYCRALLVGLRKERFYVISLSTKLRVLGQRIVGEGSLAEVPAYPRLVVETALNHNAYGVILCHNHPGGEAVPSLGDVDVTRELEGILSRLGIALMDHIIVADGETYSMAMHGDFTCSLVRDGRKWAFREEDGWDATWDDGG
ncbi:MAG: DNA repair protein RadC [Clostridiales bacterium]|nr:DNA repair protein RadC [Clostridiales bacterium]